MTDRIDYTVNVTEVEATLIRLSDERAVFYLSNVSASVIGKGRLWLDSGISNTGTMVEDGRLWGEMTISEKMEYYQVPLILTLRDTNSEHKERGFTITHIRRDR